MNRSTPVTPPDVADRPDDPAWFRHVLGHYPTGVTVVTGLSSEDIPVGMVIGSFTSVSLDPPLIAFLPALSSTTWPRIMAGGRFCVNVLSAGQGDMCRDFSTRAPERFERHAWRCAPSGSPVLKGVIAWIDCDIADVRTIGDHYLVLGRVRALGTEQSTAPPLVFFKGQLSPLPVHRGNGGPAAYQWPDWQ